jgi:HEAT repeat protein
MRILLIVITIIIFTTPILAFDINDDDANKLYQEAYNLVLDNKWSAAIEKFKILLDKYGNSSWEDDARFWMCYSMEKQNNNLEKSFECYEDFIASHDDSKWRDDAIQNLARLARELEKQGKDEYTLRVKTIEDDVSDELTLAAIRALSSRGDQKSFESLVKIYDSNKNERIRKKMVYIIGSFNNNESNDKLKDIAVNDKDEDIRGEALFWLADDNSTKDVAEFLQSRAMNDKSQKVQKKAIFSLGEMDENFGIPYLYKVAKDHKDEDMRADAVFWIGDNAKSKESIKQLSDFASNDASEKVRKKAIFALSETEMEEGVDALILISKKNKDPELRAYALFWLSQKEVTEKKITAIKDAVFNDPDQKVQEKAVFALHELDKNRGLEELINIARNHKSTQIRKKAIFWLGESNDQRAIDALEEILMQPKN